MLMLAEPRARRAILICALIVTMATSRASAAEAQRPWRVLLVHSYGSSAPPFTTHSTAFEATIKRELGAAVDLDEVSLDMARFAQPDMQDAFADFLIKRTSKWQPDLVVPIGSPAGRFVATFREKLFPDTPIVYTGMDKRTLPPDAFAKNATFLGESFDLKGWVDDILKLAPETNNVVVVLGATPLERYWAAECQKAFEPFADRVTFTYLNDLSFDQMLDRVSKLPPRSFILLGLFLRDASGVTYNEDDALARLHAVARAPINGLFQNQVGIGIVGGRLYQGELEGVEGARIAARILRGESASSIPPKIIGTGRPLYDWRELRRWKIDESRLPPDSVVLFRQPTLLQRYRWHVLAVAALIVTQALLIFGMLVQRRRRGLAEEAFQQSQAEVHQKRAELAHVSRVAVFGELTAALAHELNQPLTAIRNNAAAGGRLLQRDTPDLPELRDVLVDISSDTKRASDVIRRLREMLKPGTPDFAPVDLNEVIRTVELIVHHDAMMNRADIQLDLEPGLPRVMGDAVQLQQVILNLIVNAMSAMSNTAREARQVRVRTGLRDLSNLRIEVRDNGVGIASEKLERIFEPFVTSKADGLGMGLSICRSIIERHRGTISASNNADRGATFVITLPLNGEDH